MKDGGGQRLDLMDSARSYDAHGWCRLDLQLLSEHLDPIRGSVKKISAQIRPEVVLEENTQVVRAIHGCHNFDEASAQLARDARLLDVAELLLDSEVYVYQFKVNLKQPFEGARWPWHQDFAFWAREDGMPSPRAVTIAIALDDIYDHNGPVVVIPGSHKLGLLDEGGDAVGGDWRRHVAANLSYTIADSVADELIQRLGSMRLTGHSGSAFAFHPSIVHASSSNRSSDRRALVLITYNAVSNASRHVSRPSFLVEEDSTPLRRRG